MSDGNQVKGYALEFFVGDLSNKKCKNNTKYWFKIGNGAFQIVRFSLGNDILEFFKTAGFVFWEAK